MSWPASALSSAHSDACSDLADAFTSSAGIYSGKWRRRESNPANSMIWALYHHGISHKSALRRGRWVARVRYYAWRTAIPRLAWTNGTMAVPRRGVSRALWYRPRVHARGRQLLTLRLRSVGNRGDAGA